MPNDAYRPIRLRWDELTGPGPAPGSGAPPAGGAPRFLGRIRDGGAIPTAPDRVFLANPARLDGPEAEGSVARVEFDATRSIPVAVLGPGTPKAGDLVVAFAIGGRWVASMEGRPSPTVPCVGCSFPRKDLTVTWANAVTGAGSTVMAYDGASSWVSGCVGQVRYRLECRPEGPAFAVAAFLSSSCPDGSSVSCTEPGRPPGGLTLSARSCDPFLLRYEVDGCPSLASQGFVRFTITA